MRIKTYAGLREAAKWMGYPILALAILFLASLLMIAVIPLIKFVPPLLSLLGLIGFIKGFRSVKVEIL